MSTVELSSMSLEKMNLDELIPCEEALVCLSEEAAKRFNVLPIATQCVKAGTTLTLACGASLDGTQRERLIKHVHRQPLLRFFVCEDRRLQALIHEHYQARLSLDRLLELAQLPNENNGQADSMSSVPTELVNALLKRARRMGASDIHLSPQSNHLQVRFRVDGVLLNYAVVNKSLLNSVSVRIKIMAALDIAETRYPQDGQFRRCIDGHAIDFRVSTFPTVAGENTVLRIIDTHMQLNSLAALNLPAELIGKLQAQMRRPNGMIVVCGPTGSGKSTTLFALLDQLDAQQLNLVTLEDPVEHHVEGIRQTSIDVSRDWGYAQALRAMLRQDPDVLLIGEVRDPESCAMALRAVSTGHSVLTTVHAACSHTGIHRLRELNASGGALALGLSAIIAQRLLRRVCGQCQATDSSCEFCHGTGYHGRQVVMEIVEITENIARLLESNTDINTIRTASHEAGFCGMREQAMRLVDSGFTTIQEVERVLGVAES